MKKILFIFGTRPEAIKFAPLINEFKNHSDKFKAYVCVTAQHREMLDQVLSLFSIKPDYDLDIMKENQSLFGLTASILVKLQPVIEEVEPDLIFVQGDTATAFIGALAGFYKKVKIAHLEAGLRSGDKYSPFPEEANRTIIGHICDYHFAPTPLAKGHLSKEGIEKNVYIVGNSVIDALFMGLEITKSEKIEQCDELVNVNFDKKVILATGHRRESFGKPFEGICRAIKRIAADFEDEVEIVFPVHLNPLVRETVNDILSGINNVHLIEPQAYSHMIKLIDKSYMVVTDSGGVQEEAPSLGKPVLVLRDVTERVEGIEAGTARLVGTDEEVIYKEASKLLVDSNYYDSMSKAVNPYGNGTSSKQILKILLENFDSI